jgi:hypothetical protein
LGVKSAWAEKAARAYVRNKLGMVVQAYNPRTLTRLRKKDHEFKASPGNISQTLSQKQSTKQMVGGRLTW